MSIFKVLWIKQFQIYYLILKKDINLMILGLILTISIYEAFGRAPPEPYYGRLIGTFKNYAHGIKGSVYAIDESTLFIKGFAYDGTAPDAFFWVGRTPRPSPEGTMIVYPEINDYAGSNPPILQAHKNSDIILRLPMGKRIKDIRWLSVWCRRFTVDFGEVFIPTGLDVPKPRVLPEFRRLAHGLRSSNISILDAKTFYIPNFHYDGLAPDAYFWVGTGPEPNIMGSKVSNEVGSFEPLRIYQGEDIEIQLNNNLTVYDIDWLAVWCIEYRINFGHVYIPRDLDVPPALGQTKLTPPWWYNPTTTASPPSANNCRELLKEKLHVKWTTEGEYLYIELLGRINEDQCIIFGISGTSHQSDTLGADVVVAYYDKGTNTFQAQDYFISKEKECDGKHGVCPDEIIGGKNDIIITKGERKNDITRIKYKRLIKARESHLDREIPLNRKTSVVAAISQLSALNQPSFNFDNEAGLVLDTTEINFSSKSDNTCTNSLYNVVEVNAPLSWPKLMISGEQRIYAKIGPKHKSGIYLNNLAWYLNNLLLPELYVERGETYTFIVEGGNDPSILSRYHPLYITDSAEGDAIQYTKSELKDNIYAGIIYDEVGYPIPLGVGRYCEYKSIETNKDARYETFNDYMKSLTVDCEDGEAGYFNWTVPMDAPDLLYYQCFVHKSHGGKIRVVDSQLSVSSAKQSNKNICLIFFIHLFFLIIAIIIY